MYVFELYARRLAKRKMLLVGMIMLPILLAVLLAEMYEPDQINKFTRMMSSMVGILIVLTVMSTMLFSRDRQHKTTQRIYLSTQSKLSFYGQMVSVFLTISTLQLIAMVLAVERLLPVGLTFALSDYIILFSAYCLLIIIVVGIGILVINRSHARNGGNLKFTAIGLVMLLLVGVFGDSIELPLMIKPILNIVPTYWLAEVISILFDDPSRHVSELLVYMACLLLCAGFILLLLTRTKTEKI